MMQLLNLCLFAFLSLTAHAGRAPIECPIDEVPVRCVNPCQSTCDNPDNSVCAKEKCELGCECQPGFIRIITDGPCVPEDSCPGQEEIKCSPGEVFLECGTACPTNCRYPTTRACTLQCVPGCYCLKGLLRNTLSKQCVAPESCPDISEYP